MLVMVVFFIAFRWIHLSTPLIRLFLLVLFFFSSRRRHTMSLRDWSSDVCSSDLGLQPDRDRHGQRREPLDAAHPYRERVGRSEERRVGKECRSRTSPYHYKDIF